MHCADSARMHMRSRARSARRMQMAPCSRVSASYRIERRKEATLTGANQLAQVKMLLVSFSSHLAALIILCKAGHAVPQM